ncbi:hypothetical protein VNO77_33545 [Canavalia gladiata]|uniref:F-box domain-containing protein n=1 Tax=Canavalia gladiata TaxID=3824 RepID=A0AAN9KEX4_CANGL
MPRISTPKRVLSHFKPGSAVEVTFNDEGFRGSWFSGTVSRRLALNRFMVEFHTLIKDEQTSNPLREVLTTRQLRPQPPQENYREFKSGDKVDAFHNDGWWECRVMEDLGTGKFDVYFKECNQNMVFPKEQLRIHRDWINCNWIPPFPVPKPTNPKASNSEKGRKKKLEVTMMEKQRPSKRNRINDRDRDRLSDLPDIVLLYIMKFLETKQAVQTCVLSKRWKNLCRCLTNLTFYFRSKCECGVQSFRRFVSWVLSNRDHSYSLCDLNIQSWIEPEVLNRVMKYAVCHNIQNLIIQIRSSSYPNIEALPLIFCSHSLTSLTLYMGYKPTEIVLPKSLQLPALKSLCLAHVNFAATHDYCAEPFSNCPVLDTLILLDCYLHNEAKGLHISNSTLSSLTIYSLYDREAYQLALSTPNLGSFTIKGFAGHQVSSTCNLSHVCDVYIDMFHAKSSIIIKWLQVFTNVKKLKFSSATLRKLLLEISNPGSMSYQPPCFVRLKSMQVKRQLFADISREEVDRVVKYLLRNSPINRIDIVQVSPSSFKL